jgi:hypothetical protein
LWERTGRKNVLPWEWWLGDGAYVANNQMLAFHRKSKGGEFSGKNLEMNGIIAHYRSRIEHINHLMKAHQILKRINNLSITLLTAAYFVIAHTTNIHLHKHLRYESFGNWPHFN